MSSTNKKAPGRPQQMHKRENTTGIRLTKAERFIIFQKARRTGMNMTTYIRQVALHGSVTPRLSDEDRQIVSQLIDLSNTVNDLARRAQQEGMMKIMLHFEATRNKIDEILQQLKHDQ